MARPRSASYDDIQQGILARAAGLFGREGYERSSIADLTVACGLSRGALYHYFESKEAILFALLDTHVRGLLERLEAAAALGGTPVEQLTRAIETMVVYNAASPSEQVILLNDLGSLGEREQAEIVAREKQIVELIGDILVRVDRDGRITRATRKVHAMMLFGIINYAHTWYDPAASVKPKQLARMATDLFLNGFLAGERGGAAVSPATSPVRRAGPKVSA